MEVTLQGLEDNVGSFGKPALAGFLTVLGSERVATAPCLLAWEWKTLVFGSIGWGYGSTPFLSGSVGCFKGPQ